MFTPRQLRLAILAVLAAAALQAALTLAGLFDPRPVGPLLWEAGEQSAVVAPGQAWQHWLPQPLPQPFTLALRLETGDEQSAETEAGLLLGNADMAWGVALSNRGYLTVWEVQDGVTAVIHPWQPWANVRRDGMQEIGLALQGDSLTILINQEVWRTLPRPAALAACGECRVGLWGNGVEESAEIRFTRLRLYAEEE
jgi:hypothetical protein